MMFWNAHKKTAFFTALICLFTGAAVAQGNEKVVDRFETGSGTYVRSLLHDKAANSLWVGTSVGAMEIDLKSSTPLRTFTRNDGLDRKSVV